MSELTTADLAGRTTPRTDERDAPMDARKSDSQMANVDDLDGQPMGEQRLDTGSSMAPPHEQLNEDLNNAAPLFPTTEAQTFRSRWTEVQTGFVDEPRHAVEQADGLVAEMMKQLAEVFADERSKLEEQWSRGSDISTEDLRQALRRYRSFFDRLLSV
jgi:hypothetical protein